MSLQFRHLPSVFTVFQFLLLALIFAPQESVSEENCWVCTYDSRIYKVSGAGREADWECQDLANERMTPPCRYLAFNTGQVDAGAAFRGQLTKCR